MVPKLLVEGKRAWYHQGRRVCANCEGVSSVSSLFITGIKDESFAYISNCESSGGVRWVCEDSEGVMSECV